MVGQLWSVLELVLVFFCFSLLKLYTFSFSRRLDEISEIGRGAIN